MQVESFLPSTSIRKLRTLRLCCSELAKDRFGWLSPNNGMFKVKEAYGLEAGWGNAEPWRGWKFLWKVRTQQRVKVFLWLLAHDRLMTNNNIWRRNMALSAACA